MKSSADLYEKYAGKTVQISGPEVMATVCGHNETSLIVAFSDDSTYIGWTLIGPGDILHSCFDNEKGYLYASEEDIILQ